MVKDILNYIEFQETFAVGINMGIKSVFYKFIHMMEKQLDILCLEYGQAAGRAGRRGKDKKGYISI